MEPLKQRTKKGPEAKIQEAIIKMLRERCWHVEVMHGNMLQFGIPDLFATHSKYRQRWIEVKNPTKYKFTPAQLVKFPKLSANGAPIWILTAATESEYQKLFRTENWYTYLSLWRSTGNLY
jgi:hypothetical protein